MVDDSKKNSNKIITIAIICVLTLIAAIAGATYAFFSFNVSSGKYITGSTGLDENTLKLDIVQLSQGNGKLIPQVDSGIQKAASGSSGKGTCIDGNTNTVCKVYSITITNQSSVRLNVEGKLDLIAEEMPNLKWARGTSATTGFPTPAGAYNSKEEKKLSDDILEPFGFEGNSKTYYVVIWISERTDLQGDTGLFSGTVSFSAYVEDVDGGQVQGVTSAFRG